MAASTDPRTLALEVPASHPALPGHFPGDPVVPGVLLLARVIAAAEDAYGLAAGALSLPQAKFARPLRPGQQAEIALERHGGRIRFRVTRGGDLLAQGELAPQAAA